MVLLAGYFCEQCRLRMGLARVILAEAARNRLQQWSRRNVRELEHAIHRAVVLARATQPVMKWSRAAAFPVCGGGADVAD